MLSILSLSTRSIESTSNYLTKLNGKTSICVVALIYSFQNFIEFAFKGNLLLSLKHTAEVRHVLINMFDHRPYHERFVNEHICKHILMVIFEKLYNNGREAERKNRERMGEVISEAKP